MATPTRDYYLLIPLLFLPTAALPKILLKIASFKKKKGRKKATNHSLLTHFFEFFIGKLQPCYVHIIEVVATHAVCQGSDVHVAQLRRLGA